MKFHSQSFLHPYFFKLFKKNWFEGIDRLCKVVELSIQCCGKLLSDSFETYKTVNSVNSEFERKFDVRNFYFGGGYFFRISFFLIIKFNMSQTNPIEVFHNTAYSVQLAYIAGQFLQTSFFK